MGGSWGVLPCLRRSDAPARLARTAEESEIALAPAPSPEGPQRDAAAAAAASETMPGVATGGYAAWNR